MQACAAAEAGARILWMATHLFAREPATLAALAQTRDCRVALMAVSPYAVHPVYAAMMAATPDELAPGPGPCSAWGSACRATLRTQGRLLKPVSPG